jgi:hypothetical protein
MLTNLPLAQIVIMAIFADHGYVLNRDVPSLAMGGDLDTYPGLSTKQVQYLV